MLENAALMYYLPNFTYTAFWLNLKEDQPQWCHSNLS